MLSLPTQLPLAFAGSGAAMAPARAAVTMQSPGFSVKQLPGISGPFGFFDPMGFAEGQSEGRIKWAREAELKHGRVAMLAATGFLVGEQFHPMWGGQIDVPSYIAWQETPLQNALPVVGFLILIHEVLSVFTCNSPFGGELF